MVYTRSSIDKLKRCWFLVDDVELLVAQAIVAAVLAALSFLFGVLSQRKFSMTESLWEKKYDSLRAIEARLNRAALMLGYLINSKEILRKDFTEEAKRLKELNIGYEEEILRLEELTTMTYAFGNQFETPVDKAILTGLREKAFESKKDSEFSITFVSKMLEYQIIGEMAAESNRLYEEQLGLGLLLQDKGLIAKAQTIMNHINSRAEAAAKDTLELGTEATKIRELIKGYEDAASVELDKTRAGRLSTKRGG